MEPGYRATRWATLRSPAARLAVLDLANQTGPVKSPCVRHAWSIAEHALKGVPDRWRLYRVTG